METGIIKIAVVVLGATGFWKLIEVLLQHKADRKLKSAEARNLNQQASSLVVENWVQWSEKMEQRLAELESKNRELTQIITRQREQIETLKEYVDQLEKTIASYKKAVDENQ